MIKFNKNYAHMLLDYFNFHFDFNVKALPVI